jgi:hypothetical protein
MYSVLNLKQFLLGRWAISRRIVDRRLNIAGKMIGESHFSTIADGLHYAEAGRLYFGAYEGPVVQQYLVTFRDEANADFRDPKGNALFQLNLSAGFGVAIHHCAPDFYLGRFRVCHDEWWSVAWSVEGPRKRYRMLTLKMRLPEKHH